MAASDISGADGHGVFRLPQYIRRIKAGGLNTRSEITVIRKAKATAVVDGDNGLGSLVVSRTVEEVIALARDNGVGWVATRNGNHAGAAAVYAAMPLQHDMIGLYFAVGNANHLPPCGGIDMLLSTNPIAVAVPALADLTLTALYNVLAKLRGGEPLTERERDVHDRGLVGVLRRLHDELDRVVFAAYGWPADLSGDELLSRLVALNRERREEEWRGRTRWLRPELQTGIRAAPSQREIEIAEAVATQLRQAWPRELAEQFKVVRDALVAQTEPAAPEQVAAQFVRARRDRVAEVLATLVSLGQARETSPGRYAP
jgi:hypothetical protein